ncbi:elicitor-responsive protein 1 [Asparagus officinalis]|uniref:elicitor-responsive protein 1 n=1 Tax=Asparagus officinalis TaxID=4686 RepID=UPI00098DE979|nr:elicitor-responsive protein 1 [Asparagus officinalis]
MKGGALEVLLVNAEGLKHARLLRSSSQYVITQCGSHIHTSKSTTGKDKKAWWNEKFVFKLTNSEWKSVTKIKLKVMEKDKLLEDCSLGEATIYLRGILREGERKGITELKPAPYNIVLKDRTYGGELKVGLKFDSKECQRRRKLWYPLAKG